MIEISDFDLQQQVELIRSTNFTTEYVTLANCEPIFKKWFCRAKAVVKCHVNNYRTFCNGAFDLEDLELAAWTALLDAVSTYDPANESNANFFSYAKKAVGRAVHSIVSEGTTQMLSPKEKKLAARINSAIKAYKKKFGEEPTLRELAEITGLDEQEIISILEADEACKNISSVNRPCDEDDDTEVVCTLVDTNRAFEDIVEGAYDEERLSSLLDSVLKPREALAVKLRFGFIGGREHSYQEVGDYMGISRQAAHKTVDKAVDKLRKLIDNPYAA